MFSFEFHPDEPRVILWKENNAPVADLRQIDAEVTAKRKLVIMGRNSFLYDDSVSKMFSGLFRLDSESGLYTFRKGEKDYPFETANQLALALGNNALKIEGREIPTEAGVLEEAYECRKDAGHRRSMGGAVQVGSLMPYLQRARESFRGAISL